MVKKVADHVCHCQSTVPQAPSSEVATKEINDACISMAYLLGGEHSSNNDVYSQDILDNLSQEDL